MPIINQNTINEYVANGTTYSFPFTFTITDISQVQVYLDNNIQATGFDIVPDTIGGTIVFFEPPINGTRISIQRYVPLIRETNYLDGGALSAVTLDHDFDNIVMMIQDLNARAMTGANASQFDMGGKRITNLGDPIDPKDAANKKFVMEVINEAGNIEVTPGILVVTSLPINPDAVGGQLAVFLDVADQNLRGLHGWDGYQWVRVASLLEGSVTIDKLASGITAIEVLNALPTTGNSEGRTVFLTIDKKLYRYTGTEWTASVPTVDLVGTITETQIANNSITTPKLVTNAVTSDKITAGAITADKIAAGSITADKIVAGTISSAEIATSAITAEKLSANSVTAGKIVTGAVTSDKIYVDSLAAISGNMGSLTAGNITLDSSGFIRGGATSFALGNGFWQGYDGGSYKWRVGQGSSARAEWNGTSFNIYDGSGNLTISSGAVQYGFINGKPTSLSGINTTESNKLNGIESGATVGANSSNLNIGLGVNQLPNTEFLNGNIAPAVIGWNPSNCTFSSSISTPDWTPAGGMALLIYQGARSGNSYNVGADVYLTGGYGDALKGIPVIGNKRYEFSCKTANHRCDSMLAIDFFDSNNVHITGINTGWVMRASGGKNLSGWNQAVCFATAPSNAAYASLYIRKSDTDIGQDNSYAWYAQPHFGEATSAQTVASAYSPGTSYAANTAIWGQVSGAGRPQDGATVGATIGVNLNGQITSANASTYIANAAIGSAQIGSIALVGTNNFNVASATSGERMTMDNQVIKIYDSSGVLRVKLGNLSA